MMEQQQQQQQQPWAMFLPGLLAQLLLTRATGIGMGGTVIWENPAWIANRESAA